MAFRTETRTVDQEYQIFVCDRCNQDIEEASNIFERENSYEVRVESLDRKRVRLRAEICGSCQEWLTEELNLKRLMS